MGAVLILNLPKDEGLIAEPSSHSYKGGSKTAKRVHA